MKIVSSRRFGLWTKLFKRWLRRLLDQQTATISAKIDSIDIDTGELAQEATVAKESTLGDQSDDKTKNTVFGRLAKIFDKLSNLDFSSLAPKSAVKNDTTSHTAIGMLEDSTNGLKATKDKLDAHNTEVVTTHPYAKEATIGAATDEAAETTSSSLFAWVKRIRDYLYGIVTTTPYAKQTNLENVEDMVGYLFRGCSIVENSDSVGTGNQGYTIILDQTASVNDDTLNL